MKTSIVLGVKTINMCEKHILFNFTPRTIGVFTPIVLGVKMPIVLGVKSNNRCENAYYSKCESTNLDL